MYYGIVRFGLRPKPRPRPVGARCTVGKHCINIDTMVGKHCINIDTILLNWMGYDMVKHKQAFIKLLESNEIEYLEIGFKDPLIKQFPKIQEEIEQMLPMNRSTKRWLIMEPNNFKEAIMCLTTKRSKEIRKYYLQLEKLVHLYGAYVLGQRPKT